jgi:hypothetical protein
MPETPLLPLREELRIFIISCEHLLSIASAAGFTKEELSVIEYYNDEVAHAVIARCKA